MITPYSIVFPVARQPLDYSALKCTEHKHRGHVRGVSFAVPFHCNIDSKGKRVRFVNGILMLLGGLVAIFLWAIPAGGLWPSLVSILLIAAGAISLFEAGTGWCVLRAMGFKTPV